VWNASARFDPLTPALLAEKLWQDPNFDPKSLLLAVHEGVPVGMAMGVLRPNEIGYLKMLAVHPAWRRRGWAGAMLDNLRQRLASLGATALRVWDCHPNYLQPGQDVRYTEGILFLAKHGFEKFGETYNLICDLGQDFPEEQHPNLVTRRATEADRESVLRFVDLQFPIWRAEVTAMLANDPVSLHLGLAGGQVVGFSGYDGNNRQTGWFGPMGTHPQQRGTGLGRILLRRCLQDMKAQGQKTAVIPWVGPYGFYAQHCGARIDRVFWRFEKKL
jgi:ribosomal protein S18 acetylase RimI-like enzyme